jgi:peptide chain release factor 1
MLLEKLESIYRHWEEVDQQLKDPSIMADMKRYIKLNKEYKDLLPIIESYNKYKKRLWI